MRTTCSHIRTIINNMQDKKQKLLNTLANVIKKNRKDKSISQLALEIDVSKSIWSMIEQGKRDAQFSTFWRVSEALNVRPSELVKEIDNELGEAFTFIE